MGQEIERTADRIYHDLISPDEVKQVRARARAAADKIVAPASYEIAQADESVETFPRQVMLDLAAEGIFRVPFSEDVGGDGLNYRVSATAAVIEELAYHSNSIAAVFDVNCILAGRTLERGSDFIKQKYLRPIVAGEKFGAFATTEPLASTDLSPSSMQTKAIPVDGGFRVSGQKRWITNSPIASYVTMLCVTPEGKTVELVIELDAEGVRVGDPDKKLGNRGQLTADVYLDDVFVPEENLIGDVGSGLRLALSTLTYGRIGIAAAGVGMAQAAFDRAMAHLKTREAFGQKLGAFQHWQFKMAERATEIENARNLYIKAAYRMDQGEDFPEPEAGMAKYYGSELATTMARDAIQILGGYGFMRELSHDGSHYKVEEIYRDAKIGEIYEGTNEIQRLIIARTLFGKSLTG